MSYKNLKPFQSASWMSDINLGTVLEFTNDIIKMMNTRNYYTHITRRPEMSRRLQALWVGRYPKRWWWWFWQAESVRPHKTIYAAVSRLYLLYLSSICE